MELRVNPSTVTRRLELLERRIGVELFSRMANGLQITAHGREVAARVEHVGRELAAIDSELREDQGRLTGEVALGIPQALLPLLMPHLRTLHEAEPGIDIELLDSVTFDAQSGADLWIEATMTPATELIARPLGRPRCALFAGEDVASALHAGEQSIQMFWMSLDDPLLGSTVEPPLRDPGYSALPVRLQTRSIQQQCLAIEMNLGIGVLPLVCAVNHAELVAIGEARTFGLPHWLMSRAEMRRVRRLQVVSEWLRKIWARPEFEFAMELP